MWRKIEEYKDAHKMINKGDRVLLGMSGGADSVLLARYLITLARRQEISLVAVHVNHQLRGAEADRDQEFVRVFCDRWKIPCHIYREDVGEYARQMKYSLEEAGRIIRYRCFLDCAQKTGCLKIALAHHADDLAETMIFRLSRGTGPEGLPGILPVNGRVIRPLLCLEKEEIRSMLAALGQDYVEDSSNAQTDYSRNYIRQHILPGLRELNPQAVRHMASLSGQMWEQNDFIRRHFDQVYENKKILTPAGVRFSLSCLIESDSFTQKELIRRMLFDAGGERRDIASIHVTLVQGLLGKKPGKRLDLPHGIRVVLEEDHIYLYRSDQDFQAREAVSSNAEEAYIYRVDKEKLEADRIFSLKVGEEEYQFELIPPEQCEIWKNDCVKYFNYDRIKNELFLRTRKQGDYLVIDHPGKRKLLRRYFIDQKIPANKRDKLLLLAEGNHILWVTGGRISEAYKVTAKTGQVLCVTIRKQDGGK